MNLFCNACNIKIDGKNYLKDRSVCQFCYNRNKRKNNSDTSFQNQQPNIEIINTNMNNRTLIIGFSNCGKTYPMNSILLQKQGPIFIITKSLNQYPNIKGQTSDEIQPIENYENSTVFF